MKVRDIGGTMGSTANSTGRGGLNSSAAGMLSSGGLGSQTAGGVVGKGGVGGGLPRKAKPGFNKTH